MKSFLEFIIEARVSQASQKAQKLGFTGDGHGYWVDKQGEIKAQTVKGQLQFLDKDKKNVPKDNESQAQSSSKSNADSKLKPKLTQNNPGAVPRPGLSTNAAPNTSTRNNQSPTIKNQDSRGNVVTIVFGKFNPPTKAHLSVLTAAKNAAMGGDLFIFPSRTQDSKKNPLDPQTKIDVMKLMFPQYIDNIVDDEKFKTIFDALISLNQQGYNAINIICGSERVSEIDSLTSKSNGQIYNYDTINVISAGANDADSENQSSAMARKSASQGDFDSFKKTIPAGFDEYAKKLYDQIRNNMKVSEMWQISPEYDWKGLRDNYINGKIFKVGDMIESCNTGLTGTIIRSGANHLICVTECGIMFKSWIKDVCEVIIPT
jgi:hypothetical protein